MISIHPLISNSTCHFFNALGTVSSAPTTFNITVTFMVHSFQLFAILHVFLYLFVFFYFLSRIRWNDQIDLVKSSFFLLIHTGLLAEIRRPVCVSKSQRILCVSFSRTDSGWYIYHLVVWSNSNLLHNSHWIPFPTHSYQVLYAFCASVLHSLIM